MQRVGDKHWDEGGYLGKLGWRGRPGGRDKGNREGRRKAPKQSHWRLEGCQQLEAKEGVRASHCRGKRTGECVSWRGKSYFRKVISTCNTFFHEWTKNIIFLKIHTHFKPNEWQSFSFKRKVYQFSCTSLQAKEVSDLRETTWSEVLPTHPGCFCMITAKAVICSKMMKSIIDVWFATKTCFTSSKEPQVVCFAFV